MRSAMRRAMRAAMRRAMHLAYARTYGRTYGLTENLTNPGNESLVKQRARRADRNRIEREAPNPVRLPAEFDTPSGLAALLRHHGVKVEFSPADPAGV